jgi:hypothetical protein
MYNYELGVQLEGIGGHTIPKRMENVFFQRIESKLHASTIIESRSTKVPTKRILEAINLLHESILRLTFIYKRKITLRERVYYEEVI